MTSPEKKKSCPQKITRWATASLRCIRDSARASPAIRAAVRRGLTAGRATALALKEAYRPVNVREGDKVVTLPAIQAVLRSQVALAAKGNGPAQRTVIETIQAIEREIEAHVAAKERALADTPAMSDLEVARRIAFLLSKPLRKAESDASST